MSLKSIFAGIKMHSNFERYYRRFRKYSFVDGKCSLQQQYEASIIRLYHTIEKGLAYENYRPGFGSENIRMLISSMEQYASQGFDTSAFFYETALSCLNAYVDKNKQHGLEDPELEKRINALPGKSNDCGGVIRISAPEAPDAMNYKELLTSRHSIRHFSDKSVNIEDIESAIRLAQYTPSACNRQGWKTIIIADKEKITQVLSNQNGNRGFGNEFDKLLVITADLRAQQRNREVFQAFIDGGMYAENVLNSLYYYGIGAVPLSASLTKTQEENVNGILGLDDAEVLILFIGIGNYPEGSLLTTRSERKNIEIERI